MGEARTGREHPAGGTRVRQAPRGRFLAPNGKIRTTPLREVGTERAGLDRDQAREVDRIRDEDRRREVQQVAAAATLRDEPECVGPRWLADYAQVAQLHHSQQHKLDVAQARERRPTLTVDSRIDDIERRARRAHQLDDIAGPVWIMRQDIARARKGGRRIPDRTIRRLEALEALLDGVDDRNAPAAAAA